MPKSWRVDTQEKYRDGVKKCVSGRFKQLLESSNWKFPLIAVQSRVCVTTVITELLKVAKNLHQSDLQE